MHQEMRELNIDRINNVVAVDCIYVIDICKRQANTYAFCKAFATRAMSECPLQVAELSQA